MVNEHTILIGQRLKFIRELLLLTIEEVYKLTNIKPSTLRRIESGYKSAIEKRIDVLCNLYQIKKKNIIKSSYQLPSWISLRRNVLRVHRNNDFLIKSINKTPYQKKALQFRVMQSNFLNSFKSTDEVISHIQKKYNWTYRYEEILMALDSLVDDYLLEMENLKSNPRKFRKARKPNRNIQSIPSVVSVKLEEIIPTFSTNYVTPAYERMSAMLLILKEGNISRSELYKKINYGNIHKNHLRSLKVLIDNFLLEPTEAKSTSSKQNYRLTDQGKRLLEESGVV